MKKRIILLAFFASSVFFIIAQNAPVIISGVVTDIDSGSPVHEQLVFIVADSLSGNGYYNSVFTNELGEFTDTFTSFSPQGMVTVFTYDCMGQAFFEELFYNYNNLNLVADFQVCSSVVPFDCFADFTWYQMEDLNVQFQDYSWPQPGTWHWDFGDGTTSEAQNPAHQFADEGVYPVTLEIIVPETGCTSAITWEVYVGDNTLCDAWFFWYPSWEDPNAIQFENYSNFYPGCYYWEFGDGVSSTESNPVHIYPEMGEYEVTLTVVSADSSCVDTFTEMVFVEGSNFGCNAEYWYFPIGDLTIQFEDYSSPQPDSYFWNFGDGTTSDEPNPVHTFGNMGVYNVCLTITNNSFNCEDTRCYQVFVDTAVFVDCFADFAWYQMEDLNVQFQDYSWPQPGTWHWDFGDGATSEEQNPAHQFADEGVYPVTLEIIVPETGCTSAITWEVYVGDNTLCDAWFFWYPSWEDPNAIQFENYSNFYPGSYYWEFGDGTTSTESNPVHIYPEMGEYEVTLTVVSADSSCVDTFTNMVFVDIFNGDCESSFEYFQVEDLTYHFDGFIMNGQSGEYFWDFGDGNSGFGPAIDHSYAEEGNYSVCLTTFGMNNPADSCVWTSCQLIVAGNGTPPMQASYLMMQDSMNPMKYYFYDTSEGNPTSWLWDFGDNNVSVEQNPVHEYAESGWYNVCLTIFGQGMTDTHCEQYEMTTIFLYVEESAENLIIGEPYPNPGTGDFYIEIQSKYEQTVTSTLLNNIGQEVFAMHTTVPIGKNKLSINPGNLPAGIYSLAIMSDGKKLVRKIIIGK